MTKKVLVMIIGVVLIIGIGAGGYVFLSKDKAEAKEEKKEEVAIDYEHADKTQVNIEEDTYSLSVKGQYAKLAISIRVHHEEEANKLKYHLPEVKSEIVKELSKLTTEDLRGEKGFEFTEKKVEEILHHFMKEEEYQSVSVTSLKLQN